MARRPLKPCAFPACGVLMRNATYCEKHAKQTKRAANVNQPTAASQGYGHRWRKARIPFLEQHPLCADCKSNDRVSAAEVVDHVIPHKGCEVLFWDQSNWQPLCKPCHSRKTASEDGGFGNKSRW